MTLTLRPAVAGDLRAVGALHQRSRVAAYSPFLPPEALVLPTAGMLGEYWVQRWSYERDDHLMTVAERDGRLVGFTYLGPDARDGVPDADTAVLHAIHLEPTERGRGTGRALMGTALASMRSLGRRRATLWVLRDNTPARRFYARGGWAPDGRARAEPFGPLLVAQLRYARAL